MLHVKHDAVQAQHAVINAYVSKLVLLCTSQLTSMLHDNEQHAFS